MVVILTQIVKLSIDKIKGNLNVRNIFMSYGGMPSAHTALAVSMVTMLGIYEGTRSGIFALGLIFTLIIVRDAITFRTLLGKQGKLLNHLIEHMPKKEKESMPHFMERIGHSPFEVFVGALWGFLLTLILDYLINTR